MISFLYFDSFHVFSHLKWTCARASTRARTYTHTHTRRHTHFHEKLSPSLDSDGDLWWQPQSLGGHRPYLRFQVSEQESWQQPETQLPNHVGSGRLASWSYSFTPLGKQCVHSQQTSDVGSVIPLFQVRAVRPKDKIICPSGQVVTWTRAGLTCHFPTY